MSLVEMRICERRAITMNESTTPTERHFSACASLAAIGMKLQHLDVFGPIRRGVRIAQKTVKHTPIDKLYDGFIAMLAGAHGLAGAGCGYERDAMRAQGGLCPASAISPSSAIGGDGH